MCASSVKFLCQKLIYFCVQGFHQKLSLLNQEKRFPESFHHCLGVDALDLGRIREISDLREVSDHREIGDLREVMSFLEIKDTSNKPEIKGQYKKCWMIYI